MVPTSDCNLFGNPVPRRKRGLEPLEHQCPRAMPDPLERVRERLEPGRQLRYQIGGLLRPAGDFTYSLDVLQNVPDGIGLERQYLNLSFQKPGRTLNCLIADGAHIAQ